VEVVDFLRATKNAADKDQDFTRFRKTLPDLSIQWLTKRSAIKKKRDCMNLITPDHSKRFTNTGF
jgi:hypothetical protein